MGYAAEAVERAMKKEEVILQGMSGKYSWWQVAEILNVSPRTVRRWRRWWEQCGYRGLFEATTDTLTEAGPAYRGGAGAAAVWGDVSGVQRAALS